MLRPETALNAGSDGTTWHTLVSGFVMGGFALSIWL